MVLITKFRHRDMRRRNAGDDILREEVRLSRPGAKRKDQVTVVRFLLRDAVHVDAKANPKTAVKAISANAPDGLSARNPPVMGKV
jgi:hypothetical protein